MILGSATGTPAAPALVLSAGSVSASRTIGADAIALRPNATYELISHKTRTDPASTEATVLARAKAYSHGKFSMRFVVPLSWRHDHLIELRKVKGADLVEGANCWITVTSPVPALALALGANTVHAGSPAWVVVSGLRTHTKYVLFSNKFRDDAESGGSGSEDPGELLTLRTDINGRALVKIAIPDDWSLDHLIEVKKKWDGVHVAGASAWLTVVR